MKNKDKQNLHNQTAGELGKQAAQLRNELASASVNRYTKPPKNLRLARLARQKLAVTLSVLREKEINNEK